LASPAAFLLAIAAYLILSCSETNPPATSFTTPAALAAAAALAAFAFSIAAALILSCSETNSPALVA